MQNIVKFRVKIDEAFLLILTFVYVYIPIVIFLVGWTKFYISIPVSLMCMFAIYGFMREHQKRQKTKAIKDVPIYFNLWIFIAVALMLLAFSYYMGWSGGAPQTNDWPKHNAIMRDLIQNEWPVYYYLGSRSMLTYYLGQYMVPALAGKMFGESFEAAQIAMLIWNFLGLWLIFTWISVVTRAVSIKRQMTCVLMLFFFGGMLPVAQILVTSWFEVGFLHEFDYFRFLNYDGLNLQYRSNITDLRWVFQQCLVPWLTILVFLRYKDYRRHYLTMLLPNFLYAAITFIGAVILAVSQAIVDLVRMQRQKLAGRWVKDIFSIYNIGLGVLLGGMLLLYYWGNVFSEKPEAMGFGIAIDRWDYLLVYLIFVLCMVGVHGFCIYRKYKRDPLYYIIMGMLILIPLFKMGIWNDWCMSVSICPLMLLMVYILRYMFDERRNHAESFRMGILVSALCIGALYPIMETTQIVKADEIGEKQEYDWYHSMSQFASRYRDDIMDDLKYNYYSYDLEQNVFVNFIAKQKWD